jgi:hypothetical protein
MENPTLFDSVESAPSLPYAGTSGWSGSDTSRKRAEEADSGGTTRDRQDETIRILKSRGPVGATWRELSLITGWHHGTASGVLSVLHKAGRISRLTMSRESCKVYVDATYAVSRETETHGRRARPCPHCGMTP